MFPWISGQKCRGKKKKKPSIRKALRLSPSYCQAFLDESNSKKVQFKKRVQFIFQQSTLHFAVLWCSKKDWGVREVAVHVSQSHSSRYAEKWTPNLTELKGVLWKVWPSFFIAAFQIPKSRVVSPLYLLPKRLQSFVTWPDCVSLPHPDSYPT